MGAQRARRARRAARRSRSETPRDPPTRGRQSPRGDPEQWHRTSISDTSPETFQEMIQVPAELFQRAPWAPGKKDHSVGTTRPRRTSTGGRQLTQEPGRTAPEPPMGQRGAQEMRRKKTWREHRPPTSLCAEGEPGLGILGRTAGQWGPIHPQVTPSWDRAVRWRQRASEAQPRHMLGTRRPLSGHLDARGPPHAGSRAEVGRAPAAGGAAAGGRGC